MIREVLHATVLLLVLVFSHEAQTNKTL